MHWLLALAASAVATVGFTGQSGPAIFAPGVISRGAHEAAPAFASDGRTVYFQSSTPAAGTIMVSRLAGGRWTMPRVAGFSGRWNDMEPALAPDGSYLVFVSSRPIVPGGAPIDAHFGGKVRRGQGGNLWMVRRSADGWSDAVRLDDAINRGTDVFAPSIARDGSLYFMRPDAATGRFRLFRSQRTASGHAEPVPLPFSTGETTDVDPAVDPDERFLVFASGRAPAAGMDLFIVTRIGDRWNPPRHLTAAGSPGSDAQPRLSPDGRTLYFSSERVVPSAFPRDRRTAEREAAASADWNNGLYNIWWMPLPSPCC